MSDLEPNIRPLVEALNKTGLLQTFSSCEGHFEPADQTIRDRNHAEVRFVPLPGISSDQLETFMGTLLTSYKKKHGLMPVQLVGYKLFTPIDEAVDETYVLELRPFNRFDQPQTKRADINRAVRQVVTLLMLD